MDVVQPDTAGLGDGYAATRPVVAGCAGAQPLRSTRILVEKPQPSRVQYAELAATPATTRATTSIFDERKPGKRRIKPSCKAQENAVLPSEMLLYDSDDEDFDGRTRKRRRPTSSSASTPSHRLGASAIQICPHCQGACEVHTRLDVPWGRVDRHWHQFGYDGPPCETDSRCLAPFSVHVSEVACATCPTDCTKCATTFHTHMTRPDNRVECSAVQRCDCCSKILLHFTSDPTTAMVESPAPLAVQLQKGLITAGANGGKKLKLRKRPKKNRVFRSGTGPPVLKEGNLRIWFTYIAERQRVFHKWLNNAQTPWTRDPVIANGRMCNNFRYMDRESVWLVSNVIEPLRNRPADLLFNVLLFRTYLNWHKSMAIVGLQSVRSFDPTTFAAKLREADRKLGKLSNGAYCVGSFQMFNPADGLTPNGSSVKPARVAAMFAGLAPLMQPTVAKLMAKKDSDLTFKTIVMLPGVGKFLGWQTCLDLGYWNPDVYNEFEHVHVGPGAEMGLFWLFKDMGSLDRVSALKHLVSIQNEEFDKIGVGEGERARLFGSMSPINMTGARSVAMAHPGGAQQFNLMAIEGCLCEGNKYFRVLYKEGFARFKQHYYAGSGADDDYKDNYEQTLLSVGRTWGCLRPPAHTFPPPFSGAPLAATEFEKIERFDEPSGSEEDEAEEAEVESASPSEDEGHNTLPTIKEEWTRLVRGCALASGREERNLKAYLGNAVITRQLHALGDAVLDILHLSRQSNPLSVANRQWVSSILERARQRVRKDDNGSKAALSAVNLVFGKDAKWQLKRLPHSQPRPPPSQVQAVRPIRFPMGRPCGQPVATGSLASMGGSPAKLDCPPPHDSLASGCEDHECDYGEEEEELQELELLGEPEIVDSPPLSSPNEPGGGHRHHDTGSFASATLAPLKRTFFTPPGIPTCCQFDELAVQDCEYRMCAFCNFGDETDTNDWCDHAQAKDFAQYGSFPPTQTYSPTAKYSPLSKEWPV